MCPEKRPPPSFISWRRNGVDLLKTSKENLHPQVGDLIIPRSAILGYHFKGFDSIVLNGCWLDGPMLCVGKNTIVNYWYSYGRGGAETEDVKDYFKAPRIAFSFLCKDKVIAIFVNDLC